MTALADWQAALTAVIEAEHPDIGGLGPLAKVPGPSTQQGCTVYRNNSRGARGAALADVYPVCRRLIGEQSFDGLVRRFVQEAASDHGDLNRFGDGFAEFVGRAVTGNSAFAGLPWLPGLVRLEWLCHSVYYCDDDAPLDLTALQHADAATSCLRPIHSLAWMSSHWPVHEIWQAHQGAKEPPAMRVSRGDWYLVIERVSFQARIRVVDADLWRLLGACARGMTLGQMSADPNLDAERLGDLVTRQWIRVVPNRV